MDEIKELSAMYFTILRVSLDIIPVRVLRMPITACRHMYVHTVCKPLKPNTPHLAYAF